MISKERLRRIITPKKYKVDLFTEKGYIRAKCNNCGNYFWTLNIDRRQCGETVCEGGYKFIGKKGQNWDFHQTINNLRRFFEKNGHTTLDSYPVVARWRQDLEYTIASITNFQPYVTSGKIPPPANPLTIAQPCLRFGGEFNDLDNIGRTGRHLSSFVMFGQHAFNGTNLKGGYWMNRCIELNFEFITKYLKIPEDEVTYVENIWSGGGNFGPNLESMAYGLEIVNSVFMQYQNFPDGKYKEMELKIIDVGWGIERLEWLSQGTPTIYEATFGPVWEYLLKKSNLKYNENLIQQYSTLAGLLDVNELKDVKSSRSKIATQLGLSLQGLNASLFEIEALYAIGDHSRTIAFALADGAIPSNVGGGYNVRTILRRIFSLIQGANFELDIIELINRQALYLSQTYPKIRNVEEIVPTIVDIEYSRYQKTKKVGKKYIKQLLKSKKEISTSMYIELYESRGISPEMVQEIGKSINYNTEIPSNFYLLINRQSKAEKSFNASQEYNIKNLENFYTEPLYYQIPYLKSIEAKVIAILDYSYIVFDKTIFYPLGGGQAEDHGTITYKNEEILVIDVQKYEDSIIHKVNNIPESLKVDCKVKLNLDWKRREALMRHHTAVHIVGGVARKIIGRHVWQAGTDKTPSRGRLDITHWKNLTREILDEIEIEANQVVMENQKLNKYIIPRGEAEKKFGFDIYQGGAVPGENLRIVEIPSLDVEACGGTHVVFTGDIGYIRLTGSEKIQDGIVRITLTAGKEAVSSIQKDYQQLALSSSIFSVSHEKLSSTAERFFIEWKQRGKLITKLNKKLNELELPHLIKNAKTRIVNEVKYNIIIEHLEGDQSTLATIAEGLIKSIPQNQNYLGVLISESKGKINLIIFRNRGSSISLHHIMKSIGKIIGGGGGGADNILIGGGKYVNNISKVLKDAEHIILENLNKES